MTLTWIDDTRFRVNEVDFACSVANSTTELFCVRKPRHLVDATVVLVEALGPERVLELGIASGGSTALLALAAEPRKLVAVELDPARVPALDELITRRSLHDSVRPFYGVDQGDRLRLAAIAADEFGSDRIDLVIDDASHRLEETRASFETLFPLLRPGGCYVIEDWNWQLQLAHGLASGQTAPAAPAERDAIEGWNGRLFGREPDEAGRAAVAEVVRETMAREPLETLVLELVLARACSGQVVSELVVNENWVVVQRGPAALDPRSFRVAESYTDTRRLLGR